MEIAMPQPYAGAIFDMDGLLFDTELLGRQAWSEALERFGYRLTEELYLSFIGRDIGWRGRLLKQHFGPEFPFEAVKQARMALGDARELAEGVPPKPGARELVLALHERGVPLALATGTERARARRRLEAAGMAECFRTIVTSEDVPQGKPAPDTFLEAARRLGLAPSACIVFEDSCAGASAAAAAGAGIVLVPDMESPEPVRHLIRHELSDLTAALALIDSWFGARS
jgi:HAD superfamily hydrolase (TIGR01509 family)